MAVMLASELEVAEAAQWQLAARCEAQAAEIGEMAAEIGEIGLQAEELRAALTAADEAAGIWSHTVVSCRFPHTCRVSPTSQFTS